MNFRPTNIEKGEGGEFSLFKLIGPIIMSLIVDPCHMLKLARNALGHLGSFLDNDNNRIGWNFFSALNNIQESEGLNFANKLSSKHLQYEKHKMNVKLAAQTLSSSVADAIEL